MEVVHTRGGVSPFIYREGLKLRQEECNSISEEYFYKCIRTERINGYDFEILNALYQYGYLNSHMLQLLLDKNANSVKSRLSKLCDNGIIIKYHFTYPATEKDKSENCSIFFYGLSPGTRDYCKKYGNLGAKSVFVDELGVLRTLALNQFIVDCQVCDRPVIERLNQFNVSYGGYTISCGYGLAMEFRHKDCVFVPYVVRRDTNWKEVMLSQLKILVAGGADMTTYSVIPVVICEDVVHIRQVREEIERDVSLKDVFLTYTHDIMLSSGKFMDSLVTYRGKTMDGNPLFHELALS